MNVKTKTLEEERPEIVEKLRKLKDESIINDKQYLEFYRYLSLKPGKISHKRVYSIARALEKFASTLPKEEGGFIDVFSLQNKDAAEQKLSAYCAWLKKEYEAETVNSDLAKVKAFFNWLFPQETPKYIREQLKAGKGKEFDDSLVFSPEEIQKMITSTPNLRNKAMIALHYETGCRVGSELLLMKRKDVQEDSKTGIWWARIPSSKTFARKFPLKESVPHLKRHINTLPLDLEAPLWPTYFDHRNKKKVAPMGNRSYDEIIKAAIEKAGIDKAKPRIPYWIRHSGVYRNKKRFKSWPVFTKLHGWTTNSIHARRYMHTDTSDIEQEFMIAEGKRKREDVKLEVKTCQVCGTDNDLSAKFCEGCQMPLELEGAKEYQGEMQSVKSELAAEKAKNEQRDRLIQKLFEIVDAKDNKKVTEILES